MTSRLNSTPEFCTRCTPQLFAHTVTRNLRPPAILSTSDSHKAQHGSELLSKSTCRSVPISCDGDTGQAHSASRRAHIAAPANQRDCQPPKLGQGSNLRPSPRAPAHTALHQLLMVILGPANMERPHVGTQVGQCGSTQHEALTALTLAKHSVVSEVPEAKRRLRIVVVTTSPP